MYFPAPSCTFEKVKDKSQGFATSCASLGGRPLKDLAGCKAVAKSHKANAFNWRDKDKMCYYKRCQDVGDLKLTKSHGGYDIYALGCKKGEKPRKLDNCFCLEYCKCTEQISNIGMPSMVLFSPWSTHLGQ